MGTIAEKLSYLANTKDLFKDRLNSLGAEITSATTFKNYLNWLDTFYGEVSDKTDLNINGVVGRTSQETTTGANLNIFPYGTGGNGNGITFTINNDGTVVLNGTNNGNGNSARIFYNNANNPMVIEAGRYYMIPPNNTNIVYVMTDGTNYHSFNNNNGYSQLFNSNLSVKQFYVQVRKNNTTTFTNEKIYPMLATTQVTQSDWESYTGGQSSPNPDYPQPINNLRGNVAYKVSGNNLLKIKNNYSYELNGITISTNGDVITIDGTADANINYSRFSIFDNHYYAESGKTYTETIKYISGTCPDNTGIVNLRNGNNTEDISYQFNNYGGMGILKEQDLTQTINVSNTGSVARDGYINSIQFMCNKGATFDNYKIKIQLEKGTTATTYEPYIEPQTFNIPLKSKNLFDGSLYNGITKNSNGAYKTTKYYTDATEVTYKGNANTQYTISFRNENLELDAGGYSISINGTWVSLANKMYTFTTDSNGETKIKLGASSYADIGNFNKYIQIEQGSTSTNYEPYYDIELCKIDTYEDKIYSSDGRFYLNKNIGKVVLNGSENWIYTSGLGTTYSTIQQNFDYGSNHNYYANYFLYGSNDNKITLGTSGSTKTMYMKLLNSITDVTSSDTTSTVVEKIKSWLSTHNTIVYYVLATPTTTEITQENYPSLYNALKQIQDYLTAYKINKEFILGYSSPEIEY